MDNLAHWNFLKEYWRLCGIKPKRGRFERLKLKYAIKQRSPMRTAFEAQGLDIDTGLAERQHRKRTKRKKK